MPKTRLFRPPDGPFAHMDPFRGAYLTTRVLKFFRTIGIKSLGTIFNSDLNGFIERMEARGIPADED